LAQGSALKPESALSVFVGAIVLGTAAAVTLASSPGITRVPNEAGMAAMDAAADGSKDANDGVINTLTAGGTLDDAGSAPLLLSDQRPDLPSDSGAGALGDKAPRQVRWGVVLVQFAGCQGAPASARSRKDAQDLVDRLQLEAKKEFHEAVRHGDSGSADDAGRMPRGVLEPAVEYALFSLPVGGVSDVVETPRGFYVMRRSE
jgi:hypothetical protein